MSDTNVVLHLKARFGTQTRVAEAAGIRPHTLSERKERNTLTHEQMRRILRAAPEMGVEISPADFFPEFAQEPAKPKRSRG
ncbi:hypothetical protein [Phenylobacterium deserti]|uniref:XRE family transcriptional regulator n=1 Tax=Phenylobacterium deserti TaxID=1914756 RepID=A0A328AD16_9CAUL|nr:hypothetical protein [Phenylobacterium deserti]RAK52106.1 hypothetical protein DJ018_13200 [Phenylobacterium deserti]